MVSITGDGTTTHLYPRVPFLPLLVPRVPFSPAIDPTMRPWIYMATSTLTEPLVLKRAAPAPSLACAFGLPVVPSLTKRNFNLPLHSHQQKPNLWVPLTLVRSFCTYGVYSGTSVSRSTPLLFYTKIMTHARRWRWRRNRPPEHDIWISNTMSSAIGSSKTFFN